MEDGIRMVRRIAELAALGIAENEEVGFAEDLNLIIEYMEQLSKVDTGDATPMEHVLPLKNVFRQDEPLNGDMRDELQKCAPLARDGYYVVPSVVEPI